MGYDPFLHSLIRYDPFLHGFYMVLPIQFL